jgi:hypothetical protein
MKSFKEYLGGYRIGYVDNVTPIASLGDTAPKGQAGKDSRGVGLNANYTTQGVGSIKPMLTASAKKIQQKNWKDKGHGPYRKEDKEMQEFMDSFKTTKELMDELFEDDKRIPRKKGQPAGSDKHSDLYTDENPKGTIHGLGFTDAKTARTSVNKIKSSGKTHAHKMQAAIAMSQRAKVASQRAKDPEKKKNLSAAHKVYQSYIDTNKKDK